MPSKGTIIIYNAVTKPLFPAVVYIRPNCCSVQPPNNAIPHIIPPTIKVLLDDSLLSCDSNSFNFFSLYFLLIIKIIGTKNTAPIIFFKALKVNGPM